MLRTGLLAASRSPQLRHLVEHTPLAQPLVTRFVAGTRVDEVLPAIAALRGDGLAVTLDHLGEDTGDRAAVETTVAAYESLLAALAEAGLAASAEVSVKLSAVGQFLGDDGERIALDGAQRICQAADAAGTTVTLDMEDHTTTDSTLRVLDELRADFGWVGVAVQAYLRRTEADCVALATAGSRVRLCKGAYAEPASVAYQSRDEVDRSYVRCLRALMAGSGYPMIATHDPRLISIAGSLAATHGRSAADHEYQMLHGVRPDEQRRLAAAGATMRVYVPYGHDWYGYFMRRLAERPANVGFFLRSLATRS
ncbi:MAG: proline dehydrogenase [Actinophytocola sp.]|nr:proline dehydrogenase [Actinophytocola sp.]